jgi:hypothetical protein
VADFQASFVDEPGRSVEQATSTEDLRVALQHYRSFFDRLLTI